VAAGVHTVRYAWQRLTSAEVPSKPELSVVVAGVPVQVPVVRWGRRRELTDPESGARAAWSLSRSGITAYVEATVTSLLAGTRSSTLGSVGDLRSGADAAAEIARRLGVLVTPELASIWRCDLAVDVRFASTAEGRAVLAGVARLELAGTKTHPVYSEGTVESVAWRTPGGRTTSGEVKLRVYDKLAEQASRGRVGERGRIVRVERQDQRVAARRLSPEEYMASDLGAIFRAPLRGWSTEQIVIADLREAHSAIKGQLGKRILPGGSVLTRRRARALLGDLVELTVEGDAAYPSRRNALEHRRALRAVGVAVDNMAVSAIDLASFFALASSAWSGSHASPRDRQW
jgi:hypothetical protein